MEPSTTINPHNLLFLKVFKLYFRARILGLGQMAKNCILVRPCRKILEYRGFTVFAFSCKSNNDISFLSSLQQSWWSLRLL